MLKRFESPEICMLCLLQLGRFSFFFSFFFLLLLLFQSDYMGGNIYKVEQKAGSKLVTLSESKHKSHCFLL